MKLQSTTSKDQGVTNTHTLFFFFFLYVYNVKSTICKNPFFFTIPFVSMCQQWMDQKQVLTHQETHLM